MYYWFINYFTIVDFILHTFYFYLQFQIKTFFCFYFTFELLLIKFKLFPESELFQFIFILYSFNIVITLVSSIFEFHGLLFEIWILSFKINIFFIDNFNIYRIIGKFVWLVNWSIVLVISWCVLQVLIFQIMKGD